jgi:TRAP-type C4-dicarboxylate transport system permease small subunit
MVIMVLNVLWQVFSRYVLNNPSGFTDELAGFLMIWVGLLGAAYASGKGLHLAIDVLRESNINSKFLDRIIPVLIILFAVGVLVVGGGRLVYLTLYLEQYSANLKIPVGYVYLALPLSGLLITYYALQDMIKTHD